MPTAQEKLDLARRHLAKIQPDPEDLDDLSIYGLYCLEAAVEAAALQVEIKITKQHWEKANVARELHTQHGLPDIYDLLNDLNDSRKAVAYGDVKAPDFEDRDVAMEIERYVEAVEELVDSDDGQPLFS
ncbi:MAG: hypothetical protein OXD46_10075 [Chloroflexi bacterium]|nr:hypothetical protein [Chloroflexota bacterium]